MMTNKITVTWSKGANVRPAPNINNVAIRTLAVGTVLETAYSETTDADGNRWIRITASPAEYIATFYAGTVRATVEATGTPPPVGEKTIVEFAALDETEVYVTPPSGAKVKVWPPA
jgi:hypothetical protein